MVTLSPDDPTPPSPAHRQRDVATAFGTDAAGYDRARPGYPAELVARLVDELPGRDVLDVGIGTGLSARGFRDSGCRVLGVDPDERMADLARRQGFEVEISTIEEWPDAGRTFDAVISGQAWHWVDPVAAAAVAARVLRPDGRLAVFWNAADPPADLAATFGDIYRQVLRDAPHSRLYAPGTTAAQQYSAGLDGVADGMRRTGRFSEPQRWRFNWTHRYTTADWLRIVPTQGGLHQLPAPTLANLLDHLGAAVDHHGGAFTMQYATLALVAH